MKKKKHICMLLAMTCIISIFAFLPLQIEAGQKPGFNATEWSNYYVPSYKTFGFSVQNLKKGDKVTVSSSNKKIAAVSYNSLNRTTWVTANKPGKITITCKVKRGKKVYTTKLKYTILKYSNPLASCKINGKEYRSCFDKDTEYTIVKSNKKQKLEIKAKKGYTISRIYAIKNNKTIEIKNGSQVELGNNVSALYIRIEDKSGNANHLGFFPR